MDRICLHKVRKDIDRTYIGFSPNGSSVKPVHIASGSQRCIYGKYNRAKKIKQLALVSDSKGRVPTNNDIDTVFSELCNDEKIEEGITKNSLELMRNAMQRIISVDKGVFVEKNLRDGMISYSAGSKFFLTPKSLHEDAGEFIASIIRKFCPGLAQHIKELLERADDPITLLFQPVLEEDMEEFTNQEQFADVLAFKEMNEQVNWFTNGIKQSGESLLDNLRNHSNPLTQLRLFNFFCIFNLIRYLSLLEAFYCGGSVRPILLDFSAEAPHRSSVARASEISYAQMYKSINRFYAWSYAKWLEENGYSKSDLLSSETPVYDEKKPSKHELDALWNLAKEQSESLSGSDVYLVFGEAMYDMLALEASSHPVAYLRALGNLSGILYPPDSFHPSKRFLVSQDILEMILRCCVNSHEIISAAEIRQRLWERFGIVIGGSPFEMQKLRDSGMILQMDEDALEENFTSFASTLESMDFAEVMADGILQIKLGGAEE